MPIIVLLFAITCVGLYYKGKANGYAIGKADGIAEKEAEYVDKVEVETKEHAVVK